MSSLALTPVQAGTDFVLPGDTDYHGNDPVLIFTVPGTVPARVESVHMLVNYLTTDTSGDVFVLRILDPAGIVVWAGATANFETEISQTLELTWARQGIDGGSSSGTTWSFEDGEESFGWWTGRLPDMVMLPLSTVTMQAMRGQALDPTPDLPISEVAVTYTPSGVGTTLTSDVDPWLLPQAAGDLA